MANKLNTIPEKDYIDICNAIREQDGSTALIKSGELGAKIRAIPSGEGGGKEVLDSIINGSITEITSNVTNIKMETFSYCSQLTTANFPKATKMESSVFQGCSALTTVELPVVTNIGWYAFEHCSQLTAVDFPAATSIERYAFQYCSALTTANFPKVTSIDSSTFNGCRKLTTVTLSSPTFCQAEGDLGIRKEAFIYVPGALIEQYKAASNWSQYASQFLSLDAYIQNSLRAIVTDKNKTVTIPLNYYNFDSASTTCNLSYDKSLISVTEPILTPDKNIAKNGIVKIEITALTEPTEITPTTITLTMTDNNGTYSSEIALKIVKSAPKPIVSVVPVEGAQYGFALNSAGYYESQNKGKNNSYALCKIIYNTFGLYTMYLDCINSGDYYDYGLLSNPGVTLSKSSSADFEGVFHSFERKNSTNIQAVNYGILPSGENFITVKFRKNYSGNQGNDSLQFKVRMEL